MIRDEGVYLVKSSSPRMLQKNVQVSEPIVLHLERDIDTTQDLYPKISLQSLDDQSLHPVEIETGYRSIKIMPTFDLLPETHYRLTLKGGEDGIVDLRNQPIDVSWSLEFVTGKSKRLDAPVITKPMNQGMVIHAFEAAWTSNTDAAYYEVEISRTNQFDPVIWPPFGTKAYQSEVKPQLYSPGRYYMRVRGVDANNEPGAYSEPVQFIFEQAKAKPQTRVEKEVEFFESELDVLNRVLDEQSVDETTATGVLSMKPLPGALGVPLKSREIRIRVKGQIDPELLKQFIITKERMG